jgi:hypothetical protein
MWACATPNVNQSISVDAEMYVGTGGYAWF